jgi:hypothetical protein
MKSKEPADRTFDHERDRAAIASELTRLERTEGPFTQVMAMQGLDIDRVIVSLPHPELGKDEVYVFDVTGDLAGKSGWRTKRLGNLISSPTIKTNFDLRPLFVSREEMEAAGFVVVDSLFERFAPTTDASAFSRIVRLNRFVHQMSDDHQTFMMAMSHVAKQYETACRNGEYPFCNSQLEMIDRLYIGFLDSSYRYTRGVQGRWLVHGWGFVVERVTEHAAKFDVVHLNHFYAKEVKAALEAPRNNDED